MAPLVIFFSTGLLVYWLRRTWQLVRGDEDQLARVLERDLRFWRKVVMAIRSTLLPPMQAL